MGKRVYIRHLAMGVVDGRPRPHEQYAHLSCGHHGGRVSFFSSQGEPFWCKECESTCLACGTPSTACRNNSLEWGESCARCLKLSERVWRDRVRERRENELPVSEHFERAAFHAKHAGERLRECADKKHRFWDYDRDHPLWHSHTRAGQAQSAHEQWVRAVKHLLFALLGPSKKYVMRMNRRRARASQRGPTRKVSGMSPTSAPRGSVRRVGSPPLRTTRR